MTRSDKDSHSNQRGPIPRPSGKHTDGPPPAPSNWHEKKRPDADTVASEKKWASDQDRANRPPPNQSSEDGIRLQKVMAQAGVGSRRHCEELITAGDVSVNGHIMKTLPIWVHPHRDHVSVNGRRINTPQSPVYIMLYKPRGIVSTTNDDEGRRCVTDLVRHKTRLYPVGRLDRESSGLLLLTNDGLLAARLTHPRHGVSKTYEVVVRGTLDEKAMAKIRKGVFLTSHRSSKSRRPRSSASPSQSKHTDAKKTKPALIKFIKQSRDRAALRIQLREGKNRQIRRVLAQLGHPVQRLKRTKIGPLNLRDLRPGQWRELEPREIEQLHRSASLDLYGDR